MKRYLAFGLTIESEIPVPEFSSELSPANLNPCGTGVPPVRVRFGLLEPPAGAEGRNGELVRIILAVADGVLLHWNPIGTFLVRGGVEVVVSPVVGVDERLVRLVLTGPVLGVLLAQRGRLVFHGGCVTEPESGLAVAFLGRAGAGKSTMVSAMYNSGYSMVSDDLLPLVIGDGGTTVEPGFPHSKLCPNTARELAVSAEELNVLGPACEKQARAITERFAERSSRLGAIFVLQDASEIESVRLQRAGAFASLLPHWYGALFSGQLIDVMGRRRHFTECAKLAAAVPVYQLSRPRDLRLLSRVVEEVEEVLASHQQFSAHPSAGSVTCRS